MVANEQLQDQTHIIRSVEANFKVPVPDAEELQFRASLLRCAEAGLPSMKPGFVVRLYEAACDVKFASEEVTHFRHTLQRHLGSHFNLRQYRASADGLKPGLRAGKGNS
jgi:hypothetical protein